MNETRSRLCCNVIPHVFAVKTMSFFIIRNLISLSEVKFKIIIRWWISWYSERSYPEVSLRHIELILGVCMMTSSNGNIFCVTGHLCGEFTGDRWIPRTKASDAIFDVYFDLRLSTDTIVRLVIREAIALIMTSPSCKIWDQLAICPLSQQQFWGSFKYRLMEHTATWHVQSPGHWWIWT